MTELDPTTHTEYSGKVGYEKKLYRTHWHIRDKMDVKINGFDTGFEWVREGRKWILRSKHGKETETGNR